MELLVIDKSGWSIPVKIQRATTRIGSAPTNDVQLQSPQIASLHLQIFYSPDLPTSCKVVNMASEIRVKLSRDTQTLATFATLDIHDGDEIMLGDYRIKLTLPRTAIVVQTTKMIDASLSFAEPVLRPEFEAVGHLTIKNAGSQPNCQFQVEIDGLSPDCFQIDPIPLMYPGAQEEVRVLIIHRGYYPPNGLQQLIFKITAPESYPGERCIIQQGLFVMPVFEQSLELIDDVAAAKPLAQAAVPTTIEPVVEAAPVMPEPAPAMAASEPLETNTPVSASTTLVSRPQAVTVQTVPQEETPIQAPVAIAQGTPNKVAVPELNSNISQPQTQPKQDFSNLKVVHGPGDEFWNEL